MKNKREDYSLLEALRKYEVMLRDMRGDNGRKFLRLMRDDDKKHEEEYTFKREKYT